MSHVEILFAAEQKLRAAACKYGVDRSDSLRRELRAAAIGYANAAGEVEVALASTKGAI